MQQIVDCGCQVVHFKQEKVHVIINRVLIILQLLSVQEIVHIITRAVHIFQVLMIVNIRPVQIIPVLFQKQDVEGGYLIVHQINQVVDV